METATQNQVRWNLLTEDQSMWGLTPFQYCPLYEHALGPHIRLMGHFQQIFPFSKFFPFHCSKLSGYWLLGPHTKSGQLLLHSVVHVVSSPSSIGYCQFLLDAPALPEIKGILTRANTIFFNIYWNITFLNLFSNLWYFLCSFQNQL